MGLKALPGEVPFGATPGGCPPAARPASGDRAAAPVYAVTPLSTDRLCKSMNFPGNFTRIAIQDVTELKQKILGLPDSQWRSEAFRQQRYEVHRDTQTISLVFDPDFRHTHPTKLPALQQFASSLKPILATTADYFDESPRGRALLEQFGIGYFVRANLVSLKPGGKIAPHKDNNFSLAHSHRIHVPLVTNTGVTFTVGNETVHMGEGEIYEINNRRMHSVRNDGPEDRVHLIMDYVRPGERCCCGEKTRPRLACNPQACRDTDTFRVPCNCYPEP